jgi:L-lactate dehydrogenase complex protein LldG
MKASSLLADRLIAAHAHLEIVRGPAALGRLLAGYARPPLVFQDHPWLQEVVAHLPPETPVPLLLATPPPHPHWHDGIDTAVTVAAAAVPETGSLLLDASAPLAWEASLRPRLHIILIPAARATLSLEEALAWAAREPSGLVSWVTGPSRTADIEKVLVLGAQGAAAILAILYDPEDT